MFNVDKKLNQKKKRRRNEKPCFLCGEPTCDWDYMCYECRKSWYLGRKKREKDARLVGSERIEQVPIINYWAFFYGWVKDKMQSLDRNEINSRIRSAVIALADGEEDEFDRFFSKARTLGMLKTHIGKPGQLGGGEDSRVYRFPKRGTWKLLKDLTEAIRDLANYHYNSGFQDGHSLLRRIASGEVTVNDINERTRGK